MSQTPVGENPVIETLDYHTAGEPLRIVTRGLPPIPGDSMLAKRRYMVEHLDHWRTFLMLEPRGHADMYGAVLTDPVSDDGDTGRAAIHWAHGEIGLDEELVIESIIGTTFSVCCLSATTVGSKPAVIPEVTGNAVLTGEHRFILDPRDPLGQGFLVR